MIAQETSRMDQLGYVVPDLDAAVRHWTRVLGVGPFFVMRDVGISGGYDGEEPSFVPFSVALSQVGPTQIELIAPLDDTPSPYSGVLRQAAGGGLHHLAVFTEDFTSDLDMMRRNLRPARVFTASAGPMRIAYLEGDTPGHTALELLDITTTKSLFEHVRQSVTEWDGRDAIREVDLASPPN